MKATATSTTTSTREERLRRALFRGDELVLTNPLYAQEVEVFLTELLASDVGTGDLTVRALELESHGARAAVIAKEAGIAAGLSEFIWLYDGGRMTVEARKKDGDAVSAGETLLEIEGKRGDLLAYERVGLNLVQRMSGIATATRRFEERVQRRSLTTHVAGTRKTPWGLLDKRAVHLGGGGTHRLGLWDAILVKNNHLALLADREEEAAAIAARRVWEFRHAAAFIEIEVRSREAALAAAQAFSALQAAEPDACPCLLLLDNMNAAQTTSIVRELQSGALIDAVLLEASGKISEDNLEAYASSGVDAISIGALTHSARALDISQRICETGEEPRA